MRSWPRNPLPVYYLEREIVVREWVKLSEHRWVKLSEQHGLELWSYQNIHFSRHGTLLNTAAALVSNAPAGYFIDELDGVVHVATKDALRQLVQRRQLYRREWEGRYLYCAAQRERRQEQWAARQA